MSDELHVYTNGSDKVVARNENLARELLEEFATEDFEDDMSVDMVPDDSMFIIYLEDEVDNPPAGCEFVDGDKNYIKATAKSWAEWNGVGFLSTINY